MLYLGAMLLKIILAFTNNMRAFVVLILDGDWRQLIDRFDHNLVEHVLTGTKMVKMCSYYLFAVISVLFSYWVFADHISFDFLFKIDIGSGSSKFDNSGPLLNDISTQKFFVQNCVSPHNSETYIRVIGLASAMHAKSQKKSDIFRYLLLILKYDNHGFVFNMLWIWLFLFLLVFQL
jgi:hypothetical protein